MMGWDRIERKKIKHSGYPDSHDPRCGVGDCRGCDEARRRQARNRAAARFVGLKAADEPIQECLACGSPCYSGSLKKADDFSLAVWAWNTDVDRRQWAIEPATGTAPASRCPRCRGKASEAA